MQNRYVCDLADFGKYGLLRYLVRPDPKTDKTDMKLGVVWYFRKDERHSRGKTKISRDGQNTAYLETTLENRKIYGSCDLPLWDKLGCLLRDGKRCVHCVKEANVLPPGTKFFDTMLYFPAHMRSDAREPFRAKWLAAAMRAVRGVDVVCLDPDTGIAPKSKIPTHEEGNEYVFQDHIQEFWRKGHTLVIYQHIDHSEIENQVSRKEGLLHRACGVCPITLKFGTRFFFILPQPRHRVRIEARANRMVSDKLGWGRHFRPVGVHHV